MENNNNSKILIAIGIIAVVGILFAVFSNGDKGTDGENDVTKTSQPIPEIVETADKVTNEDGEDVDEKAGVTVEVNADNVITPTVTVDAKKVATFTMADVAKHNTASSCYTAVNGSVYDVTAWIAKHPGGEKAILGTCGKDASAAFDKKHGGQARPESEIANYKIGILAQ